MLSIREYTSEDRKDVEKCMIELQEFERSIEPFFRKAGEEIAEAYVNHILKECADKDGMLFIAEEDKCIVGFVCVWVESGVFICNQNMDTYCYVSDLVVLESARRKGVGTALLKQAEHFAKTKNISLIKLSVLAKNASALALYEKRGYAPYDVSLLKHL